MSDTTPLLSTVADEVLAFDTPENVVFGYQVAGIGSRFLAALVDTILIVILQLIVNLTLVFIVANISGESLLASGDSGDITTLAAIFGLLGFAFLWGYYIFFELLWNGQSPGKRWVGLRVISEDGTPIDIAGALIRNLVRIVDFLPLYYGVGVITMFANRQSRRLGDLAAGTLVVYDRGAVTLDQLATASAQLDRSQRTASNPSKLPLHRLDQTHVALAESFVSRQDELYNRREIAVYLAGKLLQVMDLPPQHLTDLQALSLLTAVAGRTNAPGPDNANQL